MHFEHASVYTTHLALDIVQLWHGNVRFWFKPSSSKILDMELCDNALACFC